MIGQCLRLDPDDRPSAEAVVEWVSGHDVGQPLDDTPGRPHLRPHSAGVRFAGAPTTERPSAGAGRPMRVGLVAAAMLAIIALGGVWLTSGGDDPTDGEQLSSADTAGEGPAGDDDGVKGATPTDTGDTLDRPTDPGRSTTGSTTTLRTAVGGPETTGPRFSEQTDTISVCSGQIDYPRIVEGDIGERAERDVCMLEGQEGDRFSIVMQSRTLDKARFEVRSPGGFLMCGGLASELCLISESGSQSIGVTANDGVSTGTYAFHIRRASEPVGCDRVEPNVVVAGGVSQPLERDCFVFDGTDADS